MIRLVLVLTVICLIASSLLAVTYSLTKEKIRAQEEKVEQEALATVVPEAVSFLKEADYYRALDEEGDVIGYAFVGQGKGYSSTLRIMIGIDTEANIKGIKILGQRETPGLGARVDEVAVEGTMWDVLRGKKIVKGEPWFQVQFRGVRNLDEIQGITGATITSDAVVEIVKEAIEKHYEGM